MSVPRALLLLFALAWAATHASASAGDPASQQKTAAQWAQFARSEPAKLQWQFPYQHCFESAAARHKLPMSLLLAVARGESNFDPNARSTANAHGLMQIRWPTTARHLGFSRLGQLYDPCANVDAGAKYLVELRKRYGGDIHRALAAYNYGPGRVPTQGPIPAGSAWYSGYVFSHLEFVTGNGGDYADTGQVRLVSFDAPYRAREFAQRLVNQAPELRIDWFRTPRGHYDVTLSYADPAELRRSQSTLADAGFVLAATP
jgi:hypothetical protein